MSWRLVGSATDELIRAALNIDKGSGRPNRDQIETKLTQDQLTAIAQKKLADSNTTDIAAAKRMVAGTARSMGVLVEKEVGDKPSA